MACLYTYYSYLNSMYILYRMGPTEFAWPYAIRLTKSKGRKMNIQGLTGKGGVG